LLEEGGIEFTNGDEPGAKLKAKRARRSDDPRASVRRITDSEAIDQDRRAQQQRERVNLSSTFRLFVLRLYQDETQELATWRKQQSE
jgi:hypothetical protein